MNPHELALGIGACVFVMLVAITVCAIAMLAAVVVVWVRELLE